MAVYSASWSLVFLRFACVAHGSLLMSSRIGFRIIYLCSWTRFFLPELILHKYSVWKGMRRRWVLPLLTGRCGLGLGRDRTAQRGRSP